MLRGKKILIGITGSIAAYKIPLLIRLLKKEGAEVQVLMTPMAKDFVTPLTLSTLSQRPVLSSFYQADDGTWHSHVDMGLWADLFLVAPLSANTLAKMATGIADNLLLTTVLSARCPIAFAPAMDLDMYRHPTTQSNIRTLQSFGYHLIEPDSGELASGLKGFGRMREPEEIFDFIQQLLQAGEAFRGKKVLVSAGPTYEPIDPVRFIGNHSTGKMGIEIALAFARAGADVELVLGPTSLEVDHPQVNVSRVQTAEEMHQACVSRFPDSDIAVMTAAVADFAPENPAGEKIKKEKKPESIPLKPTPDILARLGEMKTAKQVLAGFALETAKEEEHALQKLKNKNLDFIVLNSLNDEGAGFGHPTNKVTILYRSGEKQDFPLKPKTQVAGDVLDAVTKVLNQKTVV